MGDWLGNGRYRGIGNGKFHGTGWREFNEARAFVRRLDLKSQTEWRQYCRSGKKPDNIPTSPHKAYAKKGWAGFGDWLGTATIAPQLRRYRPFEEARAFARGLGLKSHIKWVEYWKSGTRPNDIPYHPNTVYAENGWSSWGDWLGTGTIAASLRPYRPFEDARTFARGLGLKSAKAWGAYSKSSRKPVDIPAGPDGVYDDWVSWGDWLGTSSISVRDRQYRSFSEARAFAHHLGLKRVADWTAYCASGNKPSDIPSHPDRKYANVGWDGWRDWLGYSRAEGRSEVPFRKGTGEAPAPADAST
jgi:hypothetical protein